MARLLLLRHGQSEWNAAGRWQGVADPPLTAHGEDQARAAAGWLTGSGLTGVVTSDLKRARRTGELIAAELGLPLLAPEPGLRERDVGEWSGRTTDEIVRLWPGQLEAWRAGRLERPPNGESQPVMTARVMAVVERLAAGPDDAVLLVVTHGGVIHTVGEALGAAWHGNANLTGWWVEPGPSGPSPGVRALPPEGDEVTAAVTTLL
ncbi:MAG TPA: histidine phosphatase family protein [Acidimicrobiales bacterium]|nr:histidine phosphatase family protein [Acidimicrobiales bacterium]